MNGAEALLRTARAAGIELCLANPGTTELPLVAALDAVPGMRAVLGLFEGVCTGAADGYGRMAGRPALTLLHLGPGLANGLANLHNARRAGTPVVNLVGDQATWHRAADAPLTSDIESLARPVSCFVRSSARAADLARDCAEAIAAALAPPGGVATLVVPADCQWEPAPGPLRPAAPPQARSAPAAAVEEARAALASGAPALLLLGSGALSEAGLRAAAAVAASTGARLASDSFFPRLERGQGLPALERLPYFPEQATGFLGRFAHLVLAGTRRPVAFFGYPGTPSETTPEGCAVHSLAGPGDDAAGALAALADALGASPPPMPARPRPAAPVGALDPVTLGQTLAALQPEGAIVVEEAATSGLPYALAAPAAPPHTALALTGGSIGQGLPCAAGAALACPGRRVIALQADGGGLYTVQALWTMAREGLDVTTVVCANRSYRILRFEIGRAGIAEPGPSALALTDLARPAVDWTALARGFGVPASRATTADELAGALERSFSTPGPALIEAVLP